MNILRITARAKPEKELELKQALKSAIDRTSKFEGTKNCCCKSLFEENIFYIEQEWESSENLKSYLDSKEFLYLTGAITVLGELIEQKIINAASVEQI
jgi:quinol monooxygenase YgiN